jgi:hypothetical protein
MKMKRRRFSLTRGQTASWLANILSKTLAGAVTGAHRIRVKRYKQLVGSDWSNKGSDTRVIVQASQTKDKSANKDDQF